MTIHIQFSSNSLRNTTASCDSLGIHYDISQGGHGKDDKKVIHVQRWQSADNRNVLVGEIRLRDFHHDEIRLPTGSGGVGEWRLMADVFKKSSNPLSVSRTFQGNDGREYAWTADVWDRLYVCYIYDTKDKKKNPLVKYHNHRVKSKSWLEILDPSVMNSLDNIIVTFLVAERKRRERQKA
ncbi:hypothetical protein CPB86DRAFT_739540, partial [Serendipita vermifera]